MLRITHSKNAAGAAKYFDEGLQRGDYYSTKENSIGEWGGKAVVRLGLSGEVKKEDFVSLCHNQKPDGSKLNPRNSANRKVGYDFTFSVPKSVSVTYAITGDERIRKAFEQSVEQSMQEIETNMRTQVGQGKEKHHAVTGEMVWASFTHRTSRPVDGIPDPHLHRHCFVINSTWNPKADRFQAGEFGEIKQTASYYEASFESRMAMKMRQLGYNIERRGHSWEVKGIEDLTLRKFSRRTAQIEEKANNEQALNGKLSAKQKEKLGTITRAKKLLGQSWSKLQSIWRSWLSSEETDQITRSRVGEKAVKKKKSITADQAVNHAELHLFERKSVVKKHQLKTEALKRSYGDVLPEQVEAVINQGAFHQREVNGHSFVTTRQAIKEELKLLAHVNEGRGKELPLNSRYQIKADYLNEEQKAAIHHALNDTNSVTLISGGAGTGKTTLMKEVRDGIEQQGKKFIGFAPSAAASRGVMREEGFEKADTLAQLIHNPKMQEQCKDSVIWVDEAGLIGNKDMNRLFEITKQQNARLLLTGDVRQHSSVNAGDALRILEQEAGLKVARVKKIQRQKQSSLYKRAVSLASEGKIDEALYQFDRMGTVSETVNGKDRLEKLVDDYVQSKTNGKSALIVSPTHMEGQNVTDLLRKRLKDEGQISTDERSVIQLKNTNWTKEHKSDAYHFKDGQLILEYHQNAEGHIKGERWQVCKSKELELYSIKAESEGKSKRIDLKQAERFTVYRPQNLKLAKGDIIRITKGGKTQEGTRVNNGDLFTVTGFTHDGNIKLHTGKTLNKEFGHLTHGYVSTSHSSQGKTVDHVFIAQSSQSISASSRQQFYVSISRGREQCRIYTDNKKALEKAVMQDGKRMTARELLDRDYRQSQQKRKARQKTKLKSKSVDHGKGKSI